MDGWSRGRVVLIGDAAYCGSPLGGNGSSMAMVGAYVRLWAMSQMMRMLPYLPCRGMVVKGLQGPVNAVAGARSTFHRRVRW